MWLSILLHLLHTSVYRFHHLLFYRSNKGSCFDPALVSALHGPTGDKKEVHLEHLSVHRICRGTRPATGLSLCVTCSSKGCLFRSHHKAHVSLHLDSSSCPVSSLTCWTTSPSLMEMGLVRLLC